jgi:hypothetical protein
MQKRPDDVLEFVTETTGLWNENAAPDCSRASKRGSFFCGYLWVRLRAGSGCAAMSAQAVSGDALRTGTVRGSKSFAGGRGAPTQCEGCQTGGTKRAVMGRKVNDAGSFVWFAWFAVGIDRPG